MSFNTLRASKKNIFRLKSMQNFPAFCLNFLFTDLHISYPIKCVTKNGAHLNFNFSQRIHCGVLSFASLTEQEHLQRRADQKGDRIEVFLRHDAVQKETVHQVSD